MSRLNNTPRVGVTDPILQRELREHAIQVNNLTEGRITAVHNASTAAPVDGPNKQGDYVRNSEPVELGSASSKYVILGWVCVASGTPGTWLQCRVLTGN